MSSRMQHGHGAQTSVWCGPWNWSTARGAPPVWATSGPCDFPRIASFCATSRGKQGNEVQRVHSGGPQKLVTAAGTRQVEAHPTSGPGPPPGCPAWVSCPANQSVQTLYLGHPSRATWTNQSCQKLDLAIKAPPWRGVCVINPTFH